MRRVGSGSGKLRRTRFCALFARLGFVLAALALLSQGLAVMDATSIAMCQTNKLPIVVFNLNTTGNIMRMSMGEAVGTVIE